jgi:hypothetical protein
MQFFVHTRSNAIIPLCFFFYFLFYTFILPCVPFLAWDGTLGLQETWNTRSSHWHFPYCTHESFKAGHKWQRLPLIRYTLDWMRPAISMAALRLVMSCLHLIHLRTWWFRSFLFSNLVSLLAYLTLFALAHQLYVCSENELTDNRWFPDHNSRWHKEREASAEWTGSEDEDEEVNCSSHGISHPAHRTNIPYSVTGGKQESWTKEECNTCEMFAFQLL